MRLMIIGMLQGQLSTATKMAMSGGASVMHAETVEAALQALRGGNGAELLMVDVAIDISELITSMEAEHIHATVVACGVDNDARAAVNAIQAGAKEYIPLPPDADLIAAVISAVAHESSDMIYKDPVMAKVIKLADQVAPSEASILITGESGTGKEVMSRYIHSKSLRADKPFISLNCAAIPENLLESELFGHEKGAFTGAIARRIGKFEEANGGTLLLDEISEMDIRLQAKLLRAVQERIIDRIGGTKPVPVDIRIIATSNRDLSVAVQEGTFREDLLYRLNVVNLQLPPLRKRPSDIIEIARHFATKYCEANGLPAKVLNEDAQDFLVKAPWPGNVRELENTMHRAVLLSLGDEIGSNALRAPDGTQMTTTAGFQNDGGTLDGLDASNENVEGAQSHVGRTVADVERDLILDTLDHCLGNRTHAANILGISIRTLRNKLRLYGDDGVSVPAPGEVRQIYR